MDRELTPLGQILETARTSLGIPGREAARRAHISEARWRQVVTGVQRRASGTVPVNPRALTVLAMALAVDVDPTEALTAAGMDASPRRITSLMSELHRSQETVGGDDQLAQEIERIAAMEGISRENKLRMITALREVWQQPGGSNTRQAG